MNVLEIKHDLLQLLVETNDEKLLEKVRLYFKSLVDKPDSQKALEIQEDAMIEIGLKQIENGQVMSNEEAKEKIREKFENLKK